LGVNGIVDWSKMILWIGGKMVLWIGVKWYCGLG